MSETIALFGATGRCGKPFLKLALEGGFKVQAMVRTKSKVDEELQKNEHLTLIQGDFSNNPAMQETCKGANYVVSMAGGGMGKPAEYPKDLMLNFFTTLVQILKEQDEHPKVILYQAGAFCPLPDKSLPLVTSMMKTVVGEWILGLRPNLADHTNVIQYIYNHKGEIPVPVIVSRPGGLHDKPSNAVLKADHHSSTNFLCTFYDLAVWSLSAMQDESLYGTFPFVVPTDKKHLAGTVKAIDSVVEPPVQAMDQGVQAVAQPVSNTLDKAVKPVENAANTALSKVQGMTKPVREQVEKVLK